MKAGFQKQQRGTGGRRHGTGAGLIGALLLLCALPCLVAGMPASAMKVHFSRARNMLEKDPKAASAEWARGRIVDHAKPKTPRKAATSTRDLPRSTAPTPLVRGSSALDVVRMEAEALFAYAEQYGASAPVLRRARELLKLRECPKLHRMLLFASWASGRRSDALFHFERADLSTLQRAIWFVKLIPVRISTAGLGDWVKFVVWLVLMVLLLGQIRSLRLGTGPREQTRSPLWLENLHTQVQELIAKTVSRLNPSPALKHGGAVLTLELSSGSPGLER
ncbi:MAG TPA: hypothetical protein PKO06_22680, partial [Candidatus Ozemobacteraceae bacterium]|nr:hypothetical protein [Candidatus Ozemobacteraceae bacterium]